MPEPIAVAFVEIRPEPGSFRSEADAEIRSAFGGDPVQVPAEFQLAGTDQAKRELDRVLGDLDATADVQLRPNLTQFQASVRDIPVPGQNVPLIPDLPSFRTEAEQAIASSIGTTPLVIPGQLQLEGLVEAEAQLRGLSRELSSVAGGPTPTIAQLPADLAAADASARSLANSLTSVPTVVPIGTEVADNLSDAEIAAGGFGTTLNDAATAASGVVDVLNLARNTTLSAALAQGNAAAAAGLEASALTDVETAAANAIAASEGLIPVMQNVSRQMDLTAESSARISAAMKAETAAAKDLLMMRRELHHAPEGFAPRAFAGTDLGPVESFAEIPENLEGAVNDAQQRLAAAREATSAASKAAVFDVSKLTDAERRAILTEKGLARARLDTAAATGVETVATDRDTLATDRNSRLKFRAARAQRIGPLRLAGVGLGVGTGVFAAAQAVGALGEALAVTGDEASTFSGKMRNAGSALLSADIAGVFTALTNQTHTYSLEQLRVINQTPELVGALKAMGEAGNLAASTTAALAGLQATPQFLQTALAREQRQGDTEGQIRALEQIQDSYIRRIALARQIATSQKELNVLLEPLEQGLKSTQDSINALSTAGTAGVPFAASLQRAEGRGDLEAVVDILNRRADAQEREILSVERANSKQETLAGKLKVVAGKIKLVNAQLRGNTDEIVNAAARPGQGRSRALSSVSGSGSEALSVTAENLQRELFQLQKDREKLEQRIADLKREAKNLGALRGALEETNRLIEENTQAILDEARRHQEAMVNQSVEPFLIQALEIEALGGSTQDQIRLLEVARTLLQAQLPLLKASNAEAYKQTLAQISSLNSQIESLQNGTTAEEERHATVLRESQNKAHQAMLDSIGGKEQKILNQRVRAEQTARLGDDIKFQTELRDFYRRQARNAKLTLEERRAFHTQFVQAQADLKRLTLEEVQANRDAVRADLDAREDMLQDRLTLAQLDERSKADDTNALKRLIAFYRRQSKNLDLSAVERRKYLVKLRQTQKDLRDLNKEQADAAGTAKDFSQQAFEFLQTLHGFTSNFASNILPSGSTVGGNTIFGASGSKTTAPPFAPPPLAPNERFLSPFEHGSGGNATNAARVREQRGGAATFGQLEKLLNVTQNTNALLRDIRRGVGHPEARHNRLQGKHPVETGVD